MVFLTIHLAIEEGIIMPECSALGKSMVPVSNHHHILPSFQEHCHLVSEVGWTRLFFLTLFLRKTPPGVHQELLSIFIILHWTIVLKHSRTDSTTSPGLTGKHLMEISPDPPGVTEPAVVKLFPLFRESLHSLQLPHEPKCSRHPPHLPACPALWLWPVNYGFDIHVSSRWMGLLSPGRCWVVEVLFFFGWGWV